ncbi:phosphatidylinositol-4- kinase, partial [Tulasnella sp. 425]
SASRVHCNIAFGEMAYNIPPEHSTESTAVLIEILKDIPYIDFENSLVWEDWALPDQLVFSTVSALLKIAATYSEHRSNVMEALRTFSLKIINQLKSESPDEVLTRVSPSFHGLYRAVISTPFPWHIDEWRELSAKVDGVFTPHLVDRLNSLLTEYLEIATEDIAHSEEGNGRADPDDDVGQELTPDARTRPSQAFVSSLVLRYASAERPLSGYFLVCSLTEIQWVLLGQVLAPPLSVCSSPETSPTSPDTPQATGPVFSSLQAKRECDGLDDEAEAANEAWGNLIRQPVEPIFRSNNSEMDGDDIPPPRTIEEEMDLDTTKQALNSNLSSAMQAFEDLLIQIEEMDVEPSMETYAYETMAESLILAAQTRLAQELGERREQREAYLYELLTLFGEKGITLQTQSTTNKERLALPNEVDELGGLLLPVDALVSHKDFKLRINSPPELVQLFRNFWLLCVLFRFTSADSPSINEWQKAALARIAAKTPAIILESSQDFVTSELEYNPVLRQDYLQMAVGHHRSRLNDLLPMRLGDIRYLSPGQIIFILTLYDVEVLRSSMDLPASLPTYFVNDGLNKSGALAGCMDAIAENVIRSYVGVLSRKIVDHSLSKELSGELRQLLIASCHRVAKPRDIAAKYLNRLITSFPSLMCDESLVCAILEVLTLLRKACEGEFTDEYSPQPEFTSERAEIRLQLTDNYRIRNEMLASLTKSAESWFGLAVLRAPMELQVILQNYLGAHDNAIVPDAMELVSMLHSRFQAVRYRHPGLILLLLRLVLRSCQEFETMSTHPLAREVRFSLLLFGFEALRSSRMDTFAEHSIREALYKAAFSWFAVRPQWSFGANRVQIDSDVKLLNAFLEAAQQDGVRADHLTTSLAAERHASRASDYIARQKSLNNLLRLLVETEITRLNVWSNPINDFRRGPDHVIAAERSFLDDSWNQVVRTAWRIDPAIAVHMSERFKAPAVSLEVNRLVRANPGEVCHVPEALRFFLGERLSPMIGPELKHLLYWAAVPPVIAVGFFGPNYDNNPIVLQYAHRVMEQHPVELTFFFVPQVVQALRNDALGYVERFIFETTKISQLFCHQIIWNMKANCYKDDAGEIEDPMKPMLDRMVAMVVANLSGKARAFYDREFDFFKEAKIDEEMEKIVVDPKVGVYLPSNPDGIVVDIDKKSGRPLQSHAKAPFMATFKVRKQKKEVVSDPDKVLDDSGEAGIRVTDYDVWQAAMFKVGDDCRQDLLALQIIAMLKNIFSGLGLMLYLFPYRVTATAPGCGVIDVVPNATSRDEMGRAKINDLLAFFVARYGSPDTVEFQKARLNFIQSMAAYSVACYILQIKDRHNGNIMIDAHGHIVHVDFGFLFDIDDHVQGSFKLTHEMVVLMGGRESQGYALFVQLTVKAFLAIRPHTDQLVQTVALMLGTGFPSFKGEPTIKRLRDRFAPGVTERQAADFMMAIVKNAHENMRSTVYDEFQRLQN